MHRTTGLDGSERDFYCRQLWDWKISVNLKTIAQRGLVMYGQVCGWTLARAHARSGDRIAIAEYLGKGAVVDNALADFAVAYADQNERDYKALQQRGPRAAGSRSRKGSRRDPRGSTIGGSHPPDRAIGSGSHRILRRGSTVLRQPRHRSGRPDQRGRLKRARGARASRQGLSRICRPGGYRRLGRFLSVAGDQLRRAPRG